MRMMKSEMPFRLRTFLPVFDTERGSKKPGKFRRQAEGLADFLCKQPRTIEAYLSSSEDRTISADDYWKTAIEWTKRKAKPSGEPGFIVHGDDDEPLFETNFYWQARFLADVEGNQICMRRLTASYQMDERMYRRCRLRRIVRSGVLEKSLICTLLRMDEYCLVDHQLEGVDWLSTPDELRLRTLENWVAEELGEAA